MAENARTHHSGRPSPPRFLAEKLSGMDRPVLMVIEGGPGSGKSLLASQISLAYIETAGPVLHVSTKESPSHVTKRYEAVLRARSEGLRDLDRTRLYLHRYHSDHEAVRNVPGLVASIREAGFQPGLVVLDALSTAEVPPALRALSTREGLHMAVCLPLAGPMAEDETAGADLRMRLEPDRGHVRVACTDSLGWELPGFRLSAQAGLAEW